MPELKLDRFSEDDEGHGYSFLGEYPLDCSNCLAKLAVIIIAKEAAYTHRYQAVCPICGDHSYLRTIIGKTFVGPAQGMLIADMETDGNKTKIILKKDIT